MGIEALEYLAAHPKLHFCAWLCHQQGMDMWRRVHHLLIQHSCHRDLLHSSSSFDSDEDDLTFSLEMTSQPDIIKGQYRSSFSSSDSENHVYSCPHLGGEDIGICVSW